MQLVRHQGVSEIYPENLAGLFLILFSQKQMLMDQSPFPIPTSTSHNQASLGAQNRFRLMLFSPFDRSPVNSQTATHSKVTHGE